MSDLRAIFEDPQAVVLPLPTQSHPEWKGRTLGEIMAEDPENGRRLLDFLANGYNGPFHLKLAAALLLAEVEQWGPFARPKAKKATKRTRTSAAPVEVAPAGLTRGLLQAAVNVAKRFTRSGKASLPVCKHILLEQGPDGLVLRATDIETSVRVRLPGLASDTSVVALVPKKALEEAVKASSAAQKREPVALAPAPPRLHGLVLETTQGRIILTGMDPQEAVPFSVASPEAPRCSLPLPLLAAAEVGTSTDEIRPVLTAVFVGHQDGVPYVAASDGYRMFHTSAVDLPEDFPDILIPRTSITKIAKVFKGEVEIAVEQPENGPARVTITGMAKDRALAAAGAKIEVVAYLIPGRFANIRQAVGETDDLPISFLVTPQQILQALEQARATLDTTKLICLVYNGKDKLTLVAEDVEAGRQAIHVEVSGQGEPTVLTCNHNYLYNALDTLVGLGVDLAAFRLWPLAPEADQPPSKAFEVADLARRYRWAIMPMHSPDGCRKYLEQYS